MFCIVYIAHANSQPGARFQLTHERACTVLSMLCVLCVPPVRWQGSCTMLLTPHWPTCLMRAQHTLTRLWPYLQESCGDAWAGIRLCWQQARVALQLVAVVVPAKVCLVSAHVSKVDSRLSINLPPLPFPGSNTDTAAVLLGPSRNNHPCLPECRSGSVTYKSWLLVGRDLAARGVWLVSVRLAVCLPFPLLLPPFPSNSSSELPSPR